MRNLFVFLFLVLTILALDVQAQTQKSTQFLIYHDADYSINRDSALAMKMGLLTALDELDTAAIGVEFEVVEKNHRGNTNRSHRNLTQFIEDDDALFVFGGLHSPPYIKYRTLINENRIPLLVPWAAGGPITRHPSDPNWVFRLSVDDAKAGIRLSEHALNKAKCQSPQLFLEETPWGKSNHNTMSSYLTGKAEFGVTWFGWNLKQNTANIEIRNAINRGADCIILVANYTESRHILNAMLAQPKATRVPIISHWGLTGGDVNALVDDTMRNGVDLSFIQSCFDLSNQWQTEFSKGVLQRAQRLFPEAFAEGKVLNAQAGFIHAYDLGLLINQVLQQLDYHQDIGALRAEFRAGLESIAGPVQGLVKTYRRPFSPWQATQADAHEALGIEDFCMAKFNHNNQILVSPN